MAIDIVVRWDLNQGWLQDDRHRQIYWTVVPSPQFVPDSPQLKQALHFPFFPARRKMLSLAFDIRASQAPIRSYSFFLWALKNIFWAAAIARWLHLNLPTAVSNPKHTIKAFFQYVLLKLFWYNDKNKQKEAGIAPFKKKSFWTILAFLVRKSNLFSLRTNDLITRRSKV